MALPDPPAEANLAGPYLFRGHRTVIVGDTGHGKTTLTMQFVAAAVTGSDVLGHRGAGVGPGMIVDLEQGLKSIKRLLPEVGLHERDDVIYVRAPDGLSLDSDDDHRAALDRALHHHRPSVVMLDPFYKAHRGDSNDERAVVDLMRYLDALRSRYGFALVIPAHPRKDPASSPARKLTLHDVAGSGAVTRGAELVLAIERLAHGYARLRVLKDRDGDFEVGEAFPLLFTRGEGFRLDPKEETTAEELEAQVLANGGEWRTVKEWAALLGIREKRAKDMLEQLVASGLVESTVGPPGRSPKAHCYRTAPTPRAKSGAVTQSPVDVGTAPTAPTSLRDVEHGSSHGTAPEAGAVDADEIERLAEIARATNGGGRRNTPAEEAEVLRLLISTFDAREVEG